MEIKRLKPTIGQSSMERAHHRKKNLWLKPVLIAGGCVIVLGLSVLITLIAVGEIDITRLGQNLVSPISTVLEERKERQEERRVEKSEKQTEEIEGQEPSDYWAVFLVNNQVYFGKLNRQDDDQFMILTDVFYLRAQQTMESLLEKEFDSKNLETSDKQVQQQMQLIKLGDELHGPIDEIQINRDRIMFLEQLRQDSRVVKGIEQFKRDENPSW